MPPRWGPFPFKFYRSWLFKEGFDQFIEDKMANFHSDVNAVYRISLKLKALKTSIKKWLPSRRLDHNARLLEIEHLVHNLDIHAKTCPLSMEEWNRKQALRTKHYNIFLELEVYWKQRSCIQ